MKERRRMREKKCLQASAQCIVKLSPPLCAFFFHASNIGALVFPSLYIANLLRY